METKVWAIALVVLTTLFTATGQVMYKLGADRLEFNLLALLSNYWIIIGAVVYLGSAALLLLALRGGELSVLYPFVATSYVWIAIFSMLVFHETITSLRWAGIGCIILGVAAIGLGSRR